MFNRPVPRGILVVRHYVSFFKLVDDTLDSRRAFRVLLPTPTLVPRCYDGVGYQSSSLVFEPLALAMLLRRVSFRTHKFKGDYIR